MVRGGGLSSYMIPSYLAPRMVYALVPLFLSSKRGVNFSSDSLAYIPSNFVHGLVILY